MRFPPPSVIASWPTPNYVDPPTQKPYLIPILAILTVAATGMVVLRLYARFFHNHCSGSDDWLVILALLPGVAFTVCISVAVTHFGWNRHVWDIPPGPGNINQVKERAISWAVQMLYVLSSSPTKLSLLCFYRRAFTTPVMRKVVTWFLFVTLSFMIGCVLVLCFECQPLNFYWDEFRIPAPSHGSCVDEGTALMTTGILNLIIDIIILVLPIPTVLSLHIRWGQKLQVLSIFAAGLAVVACSTMRVYEIWQTTEVTFDVTWRGYNAYLFTGVEIFVGLICACLPACRGLLKQWRDSSRTVIETPADKKGDFTTARDSTRDSTRASTIAPTHGIKKRTRTTVDVTYIKIENPTSENSSQMSLGLSNLNPLPDKKSQVWGVNGSGTNITTKAWAGKEKRRRGSLMEEDGLGVAMVDLGLGIRASGDGKRSHKLALEDKDEWGNERG